MAYRRALVPTDFSALDPRGSFFGNLFRGVVGTVGGAVTGLLSGGPVGAITGAIGGAVHATQENIAADAAETSTGGSQAGVPPTAILPPGGAHMPGGAVTAGGVIVASPLGTPVSAKGLAKQGAVMGAGGVPVHARGFHLSKPRKGAVQHFVRNRRMNHFNPRALSRAGRRISGFVHGARKFLKMTHPHHTGTAHYNFGKKRRKR